MATDLIEALKEAWAADGTLAAAGIGELNFGVDPEGGYPYIVATWLGTRIKYRNFGKGQIHEDHFMFNISSTSTTEAVALGKLAMTFLESLQAAPPTFDDGRLKDSHQTGEDLVKSRKTGTQGVPFVWIKSLTWSFGIARDRA
jgi:hypothetical protein